VLLFLLDAMPVMSTQERKISDLNVKPHGGTWAPCRILVPDTILIVSTRETAETALVYGEHNVILNKSNTVIETYRAM